VDSDNTSYHGANQIALSSYFVPLRVPELASTFSGEWPGFSFGGFAGDVPFLVRLNQGGPLLAAVYRPAEGNWYVNSSGQSNYNAQATQVIQFGAPSEGDVPRVLNYGGISHFAVFRPSTGQLLVDSNNLNGSSTNVVVVPFTSSGVF
jgi:hypothetical protein